MSSLTDEQLALLSSSSDDEEFIEELLKLRQLNVGAAARRAVRKIKGESSSCRDGYYCKKTNFRNGKCTPRDEDGKMFLY